MRRGGGVGGAVRCDKFMFIWGFISELEWD